MKTSKHRQAGLPLIRNLDKINKIMVVKLRALGDVLTTFPLIRALKERFPQAELTMVTDDRYQALVEHHPRIDQVWAHPEKTLKQEGQLAQLKQHQAMVKAIKQQQIDVYIDLYGSMRTALWGAAAGVPRRMGFNLRGRKYFYHDRIIAQHHYVVDLNLQFAERLGWSGLDRSLEFFIVNDDFQQADQQLRKQGFNPDCPYMVISPGGGWPVKCWAPEKFGQVADNLAQETGAQVIVSGSQSEQPLIKACLAQIQAPAYTMVDLPLRQVAAIISNSRLFIGNDSGPKYFAEAFKVPTLICYGPTDFHNNNPVSPINLTAYEDVSCRPCHQEQCRQPGRICLDRLSVAKVTKQAFELWRLNRP